MTVGDPALAFSLPSTRGLTRTLGHYLETRPLLLAFHRGIW